MLRTSDPSDIDPTGEIESETRALVGGQFNIGEGFSIIADVGGNFKETLSETFIWKSAVQVKLFKQIFLRGGFFSDKADNIKGDSYGVSWYGPKFSLELAMSNKTVLDEQLDSILVSNEKLREYSLSTSIRF